MRIGVLGTGMVGQAIATRLVDLGHDVMMGARQANNEAAARWADQGVAAGASASRAVAGQASAERASAERASPERASPERASPEQASPEQTGRGRAAAGTFGEAAGHGEVVINATAGTGSLAALDAAGTAALAGKVLLDVANPLDFSRGMPPSLAVANTDSLGEQIQRAHPSARVVKTLNTVTADVMVHPEAIPGEHNIFMAGDDPAAKHVVSGLLAEFGWPASTIVDLGGIQAARALEMYLPLWLALMGAQGTAAFNIHIVRG